MEKDDEPREDIPDESPKVMMKHQIVTNNYFPPLPRRGDPVVFDGYIYYYRSVGASCYLFANKKKLDSVTAAIYTPRSTDVRSLTPNEIAALISRYGVIPPMEGWRVEDLYNSNPLITECPFKSGDIVGYNDKPYYFKPHQARGFGLLYTHKYNLAIDEIGEDVLLKNLKPWSGKSPEAFRNDCSCGSQSWKTDCCVGCKEIFTYIFYVRCPAHPEGIQHQSWVNRLCPKCLYK